MPIPESVLIDLGYRLLESGQALQAIPVFERAVHENPESANAWDSLADGYAGARQWRQAIAAEQRALDVAKRFDTGDPARYENQLGKYRAEAAKP